MRLAISAWQNRISPVFDVAGTLVLVDVSQGSETGRSEVAMPESSPLGRARQMVDLGIQLLICGAISTPLECALVSVGIKIIPQTCGEVDVVLKAFLNGCLAPEKYLMPGCGGKQRLRYGDCRCDDD